MRTSGPDEYCRNTQSYPAQHEKTTKNPSQDKALYARIDIKTQDQKLGNTQKNC